MSLLTDAMQKCVRYKRTVEADGYGGSAVTLVASDSFWAAFQKDKSVKGAEAQKAVADDTYTVSTTRSVMLAFDDIFLRLSDGKWFRVVNDSTDLTTPAFAHLDMRNCICEVMKDE